LTVIDPGWNAKPWIETPPDAAASAMGLGAEDAGRGAGVGGGLAALVAVGGGASAVVVGGGAWSVVVVVVGVVA
jgi:hypothetical protein